MNPGTMDPVRTTMPGISLFRKLEEVPVHVSCAYGKDELQYVVKNVENRERAHALEGLGEHSFKLEALPTRSL